MTKLPLRMCISTSFRIFILSCIFGVSFAQAQSTQGLISGQVIDLETGAPIAAADVVYQNLAADSSSSVRAGPLGFYILPLLSPGTYRIRVTASGYQAQELQELELAVAAFLDINFRLRPLGDVWEQGQFRSVFLPGTRTILTFFGPDVDTSHSSWLESNRIAGGGLESSVSQVIDAAQVRELPLAGRDVYTLLVTQPGVTADSATARGLGLAINGQRPSASNFLLDGLENNNYLVTGPLMAVAPEAIQEYRVSTSNFTAEYGRTSGFLANAVTRSGGSQLHGLGYFYWKNEDLNANDFQRNSENIPRSPFKESQLGFSLGGPLRSGVTFWSAAFESLRSRGRGDSEKIILPTTRFISALTQPGSLSRRLLETYPTPLTTEENRLTAETTVSPTVSVNRLLAVPRLDIQPPGSRHQWMARLVIARLERPDFVWSPYKDFIVPLEQNTLGLALRAVSQLTPSLINEARIGWSSDDLHWDRPHPDVPALSSGDGVLLPGSSLFYEYRNRGKNLELVENLLWAQGRHIWKAGAGVLFRNLDGHLTAGRDPLFTFRDSIDFALDRPNLLAASISREKFPSLFTPDYDREYRNRQFYFFVQDSIKLASRIGLNLGLRYESFGAPSNTSAVKDGLVNLGSGDSLAARLAASRMVFPSGDDQTLYDADRNNWAARFGMSVKLSESGSAILRAGYGIFYDRPFDNLWQNLRSNNILLSKFSIQASRTDYLQPVANLLPAFQGRTFAQDFPNVTMYQSDVRDAYVHSYFLGLQHQLTDSLLLEMSTLGSIGKKLLTSDFVNRPFSTQITATSFASNPFGRFTGILPDVSYRGNQGISDYRALTFAARYRNPRGQFHLSYTWGHSIDNQSDPLAGDFFDLSFTRISAGSGSATRASFTRQFDSRSDRASSDFDQRHNLVFYSLWQLPSLFSETRAGVLFRNWSVSQLAAFRSGFPYSVLVPTRVAFNQPYLVNNRADLLNPSAAAPARSPVAGGELLLDRTAFREPTVGAVGNLGRNSFRGPGIYNIDLSLSRSFALSSLPLLRRLGEAGSLTIRLDAFNVLNHANLNNPDSLLTSQTFGVASYGRLGRSSGFPASAPFVETARQLQLMLRLGF